MKIVEYAKFMKLSRNKQFISIYIQICKNMQNNLNFRIYVSWNVEISNSNIYKWDVQKYTVTYKSGPCLLEICGF